MKKKICLFLMISSTYLIWISYGQEKSENYPVQDRLMAYVFNEKNYDYKAITTKDLTSAIQIYFFGGCGHLISGCGRNILSDALYKYSNSQFFIVRTPEDSHWRIINTNAQ